LISISTVISAILAAFLQYWYIFLIALIVMFFKSPIGKGLAGELLINLIAKIRLNNKEYHLLKNVTLPTKDGTTQIDHIIVSEYGIFVIETKNMKGWIFGNEKQKIWTQKIYNYTKKFQNPLHQNYKHIKTIQNILNIELDKIFSVVVFIGESTFKTDMPDNVLLGSQYIRYIKSKKEKIISKEKVEEIINILESKRFAPSLKTSFNHIKYVKSITQEKAL